MSKHRELEQHLNQFMELYDIMAAMKNLALMETRKLARFLETQRSVVKTITAAAADFQAHYPEYRWPGPTGAEPILVIGSERGFCGDFNEGVMAELKRYTEENPLAPGKPAAQVIAVGRRLAGKLEGNPLMVASVEGASVVEEVDATLMRLLETLEKLNAGGARFSPLGLTVIHHAHVGEGHDEEVRTVRLYRDFGAEKPKHQVPPDLLVPPAVFQAGLLEQYLFAVLHQVYYSSLMAENRQRYQQMQAALGKMDKKVADWKMKINHVRQEEITEEIEEIMLSAEALLKKAKPRPAVATP